MVRAADADYCRPFRLDEALARLKDDEMMLFGGGTDLMVQYRGYTGTGGTGINRPLLFLDGIEELKEIGLMGEELHIGAGAVLSDILAFDGLPYLLVEALSRIASPGLRNRATLGGNICHASPAADSLPPLMVHGARLELVSVAGNRTVELKDFITGPGKNVLARNEILKKIIVPPLSGGEQAEYYYRKVGTRKANALSKLSCAGYACRGDNGNIVDFRFALGAVAPVVICLEGPIGKALETAEKLINPIDDQRSTAAYRRRVGLNALEEFIDTLNKENHSD